MYKRQILNCSDYWGVNIPSMVCAPSRPLKHRIPAPACWPRPSVCSHHFQDSRAFQPWCHAVSGHRCPWSFPWHITEPRSRPLFDNMYKRLSGINCRSNSHLTTAAAGLQTANTGRGWIRGACQPCPDLHLSGPRPDLRAGGYFVSLPRWVPSLAWVVLARWSVLFCTLVP